MADNDIVYEDNKLIYNGEEQNYDSTNFYKRILNAARFDFRYKVFLGNSEDIYFSKESNNSTIDYKFIRASSKEEPHYCLKTISYFNSQKRLTETEKIKLPYWGRNTNQEEELEPKQMPLQYQDRDIATNCSNLPMPNRSNFTNRITGFRAKEYTQSKFPIKIERTQYGYQLWCNNTPNSFIYRTSLIIDIQAPGGKGAYGGSLSDGANTKLYCGGAGGGGAFASFFVHLPFNTGKRCHIEIKHVQEDNAINLILRDSDLPITYAIYNVYCGKNADGQTGGANTDQCVSNLYEDFPEGVSCQFIANIAGSPGQNGGTMGTVDGIITAGTINYENGSNFTVYDPFVLSAITKDCEYNTKGDNIWSQGGGSIFGDGGVMIEVGEYSEAPYGAGGGGSPNSSAYAPPEGGEGVVYIYN